MTKRTRGPGVCIDADWLLACNKSPSFQARQGDTKPVPEFPQTERSHPVEWSPRNENPPNWAEIPNKKGFQTRVASTHFKSFNTNFSTPNPSRPSLWRLSYSSTNKVSSNRKQRVSGNDSTLWKLLKGSFPALKFCHSVISHNKQYKNAVPIESFKTDDYQSQIT